MFQMIKNVWLGQQFSPKSVTGFTFLTRRLIRTITQTCYENFFWPKHLRTESYKKYYFPQDGAQSHKSDQVQEWLSTKFINKNQWPAHSPDLNPCDFFLWGYLKSRVYNPMPKDLADLKSNLDRELKKLNKKITFSCFKSGEFDINTIQQKDLHPLLIWNS